MPCSKTAKHNRIAAGILALLMLFILLFFSFYISYEAHHECIGEECPVCAAILQCENALRQLGNGITALTAVLIPVCFGFISVCLFVSVCPEDTPVSRKVRLNN